MRIEERSGKSFSEAVRPGNVDYAAVQQGKICETLDDKTDQLNQTAKGQKQRADERSEKKRDAAQQEAAPSWQKAGKATASAAAFAGVSQLAVGIYTKCASGKKLASSQQRIGKKLVSTPQKLRQRAASAVWQFMD